MELQSVIPFWWLFEGVSIMFQSSWWLKLWKEVWSSRNNEFAIIWWPWCGLGRWSLMTRPVTVWRERIYACSLTLDSLLRYCNFYTHTHTYIYILFFLLFFISFFSTLFFNPHSPQEMASPCPPSLLLLSFFLFHIWSGSCGWPGFSGAGKGRCGGKKRSRRRGRGGGFKEAINCKAQGTVKEKKRFDTKSALWKKRI